MAVELQARKVPVRLEKEYPVFFRNYQIGCYYADLVVANAVVVETKAASVLNGTHRAQVINYLRLSGLKVGYLLNFAGAKLQFKRLAI